MISECHQANYERAYKIAFEIPIDSTDSFQRDEVLELRAFMSMKLRKFDQADSLFQKVFQTPHKNIRAKAYTNYAELQHLQFNFDKRLEYLQRSYHLRPTNQLIRIIARHYFQVEADFEIAQIWIDKHPVVIDPKEQAGFNLLMAEFNESKRKYKLAIRYYRMAKINAQEANLFNYELFAAIGKYRTINLSNEKKERNMINTISWLILGILSFAWWYSRKNNKHEL